MREETAGLASGPAKEARNGATVTRAALKSFFPCSNLSNQLNICPRSNIIYLTNQKVGCSTFKLWLYRLHAGDWTMDVPQIHRNRRLPGFKAIGWDKICRMMSGGAFRFSFVRHPLRRLVSAYSDKMLGRPPRFRAEIRAVLGRAPEADEKITMDDFLAAMELQSLIEANNHWRPQHLNLMSGLIELDFIGRLERIGQDIEEVKARASLPDVPLPHRNKSPKKRAVELTTTQRARAEQIYAKDFELFGYE